MTLPKPFAHRAFGNVKLPAHYGDPPSERVALSQAIGVLAAPQYAWLKVSGSDARGFLQGMLTQDMRPIQPGETRSALVLDASGKLISPLLVLVLPDGGFLLQVPIQTAGELKHRLDKYIIMEDVQLQPQELACFTIQGPKSGDLAQALATTDCHMLQNDRCGQGGFDIAVTPDNQSAVLDACRQQGALWCGWDALEILRCNAFIAQFPCEISAGENPLCYGLSHAIAEAKGCYIGQETIAMTRDRGRPPRMLVGLVSEQPQLPTKGQDVVCADRSVGQFLTTSPALHGVGGKAFALLKYNVLEKERLFLDTDGHRWQLVWRADKGPE